MKDWKVTISKYRYLLLVLCFYLLTHLLNLTLLPIFNDESIYLDWGWVQTHVPGHLYDSLLDAKQPLMIWLFGVFANFFQDPLFAGRFVSVLFGLGTVVGIYKLTQKLFDTPTALLAAFVYTITPLFVFYDRQALLESGITCLAIWSCNALINLLRATSTRNSIMLGVFLGLGFFIKSSMLLFVLAATVVLFFEIIKNRKYIFIKSYFIAVSYFALVNILLFINPVFWQTFSSNSRYTFTLGEILAFPISTWANSSLGFFEIGFFFITPLLFIMSLIGVGMLAFRKQKEHVLFLLFFITALVLQVLFVKLQSQRYIVSFLPFLSISASYVFYMLWKGDVFKKSLVGVSLFVSLGVTSWQIANPVQYIEQFATFTKYSETAYIHGQTSGFGVREMITYLKESADPTQPTLVFFGFNVGNPESAVSVYSQKTNYLIGLHIDAKLFQDLNQIDCFTSKYPAYVITRDDQLMGMERYFVLERAFIHPDGNYAVGVYQLKTDCKGKTASLSDFYQTAINTSSLLRNNIN